MRSAPEWLPRQDKFVLPTSVSPFPTHLTAACALNAFVARAAFGQYRMLQSLMGVCAFKNNLRSPTIKSTSVFERLGIPEKDSFGFVLRFSGMRERFRRIPNRLLFPWTLRLS